MITKQEFISKWSNWWILQKGGEQLTDAFEKELNTIIEQEVANKNIVLSDVIGSCRYEQDNTTAMNCKNCGKSKWMHGSGNLL